MKIGIWCDYGQTLGPSEGIGVFIDSLARGLVDADPACEVVLKCNPKDSSIMAPLVDFGKGRIHVFCGRKTSFFDRKLIRILRKLEVAIHKRWETPKSRDERPSFRGLDRLKDLIENRIYLSQKLESQECDVWIIPYVGLQMRIKAPNIVIVHDLVCCHFPDMMSPLQLKLFLNGAKRLVDNSNAVVCMAHFIKSNDIQGILNVPEEKIRVLKSAIPADISRMILAGENNSACIPDTLRNCRYLFYPAAFRQYKNHETLVEVLKMLKARGDKNWKVVFTGITEPPHFLTKVINDNSLQDDVLSLGKVDRPTLVSLYKNAFATVVPSRYEQGSFPIMEAVALQCPAIASDIPSLREQFQDFGDAMLFAHPDSPEAFLQHIDEICLDRDKIIKQQQLGLTKMAKFTWTDAAKQWLSLAREISSQK